MKPTQRTPLEAALEVKFCALDLKRVTLEGTFEGYASLFDREDLGGDMVIRGAFRDSLRRRGANGVRMLFQHDPALPIGVWQSLHEDARGLFARGRLMTEVAKGREVLALMRAGAVDGLSIGFRTVHGRRDRRTGVRRLEAVDLWEISVVTFPMLPEARVTSVKLQPLVPRLPDGVELDQWLQETIGGDTGTPAVSRRETHRPGRRTRRAADIVWRSRLASQIGEAARLMRANPRPEKDPR